LDVESFKRKGEDAVQKKLKNNATEKDAECNQFYFISLLQEGAASVSAWCRDDLVGAQLRHSDPRITLELYAHVVSQSQRDAVEGLASALGSGQLLTQQLNADLAQRKSFVS
jgi:hypothetical protein